MLMNIIRSFSGNSNVHEECLNDISHVVMHANDKQAALDELKKTLSPRYRFAIKKMQQILDNDNDFLKENRHGLWEKIPLLSKQSGIKMESYVKHYNILDKARTEISESFTLNKVTLFYYAALLYFIAACYNIFKKKNLPVFQSFFEEYNAELPQLTQFVINGNYLLLILVVSIIILVVSLIIPLIYRHAVTHLKFIPKYISWLPFYSSAAKSYNQYLILLYAHIHHKAGVPDAIKTAQIGTPTLKMNKNKFALLNTAKKFGNFNEEIIFNQKLMIKKIITQTTIINRFTDVFSLLMYAILIAIPIIAMYMPIFMLGDIVG